MATDSGRGNPIGATEGLKEEVPPAVSNETKAQVASTSAIHAAGQDAGATAGAPPKVKTEKELEKERKKAEKDAKFKAKLAEKAAKAAAAPAASKNKEKKAKAEKKEEEAIPDYVEDTPKGEKKRLKPLEDPHFKAYHPEAVESAWYDWWEKEGFFKPEFTAEGKVKPAGKFVIAHPPPNVTGALHLGHALGDSLQDIMIRWNRMLGKTTLWIPGCDHAGISTQSVVENMLWRREGKTRHDLGREDFVDKVWTWKGEYHDKINAALRKMGGSFDWSREAFTMDANLSAAVAETFVRLFEEGTIYRANRLVNWSSRLTTALSNLEVINKELTGRTLLEVPGYEKKIEFGVLIHFKYQIEGTDEYLEVATTRIETMLGDSGIAVHPDDPRYTHLVGKKAIHPIIPGRLMPIVADTYVDKEFGTGAVKLTPAHDPNDFNLGQKHGLEFINILTDDGNINENGGKYQGQKRFDVRYAIQEELKQLGLYVDKKDNAMTIPLCERSKDVIEPLLKPQWYMSMRSMADDAVAAVKDGRIKIKPESSERSFYAWMANINDWCISRQLWWGHRCPVYLAKVEGEKSDSLDNKRWFAGKTREEAEAKAKAALPGKNFTLEQDEDVLDTWFSSGLWPFSTLGWPNKTQDLEELYPTSVLETGWDILFFWIARMVMLGIKLTGQVPFTEVYCHSLVRDSEGRKMSKSLGNVIDPLDAIAGIKLEDLHAKLRTGNLHPSEVAKAEKYQKQAFPDGLPRNGADSLRFTMAALTSTSGDVNFDVKVMTGWRKFCNKIWQASKYVLGNLPADFVPAKEATVGVTLAEKWILHKLNNAAKEINTALAARDFQQATGIVYQYILNFLCDVYIENSKSIIRDGTPEEAASAVQTLYTVLEGALTMIHPFTPFLTEELWQRLPRRPEDKTRSIMLASYPVYDAKFDDPKSEAAYELVLGCSRGARSLMSEYAQKEESKIIIQSHDATSHQTINDQVASIKTLSGKGVTGIDIIASDAARPAGCVAFPVASSASVYLHVKGRVDLDAEVEKAKKRLDKARANIDKQHKVLNDPIYKEKVAEAVQKLDKQKLVDLESEARSFEDTIKQFEQLKLE
ncbi:valine--tRNA ligase [Colletotrichum fioriniae]|uniref:valine--tRNA ligase n=1 Tax=Colletotrichum fioriniae TaxID=710243 RepID=UPI0032DA76EF|nr:valine--tRNA ligase [Colletotrichum fioriniae]